MGILAAVAVEHSYTANRLKGYNTVKFIFMPDMVLPNEYNVDCK